jgi:adenosylcobinamide kinase/adenosylcobinamide-phosphate guanylyltransferase
MKALFIGGVKSGKSRHAEAYTLNLAENPLYLATAEPFDEEMRQRILQHQHQRHKSFKTIEAPLNIYEVLQSTHHPVLLECMTLWINNMLHYHKEDAIFTEIEKILSLKSDMVFVINDVGSGVMGAHQLSRKFVDISGTAAQMIASECDEVFHCIAGICHKIK